MDVRFVWSEAKRYSNWVKHGLDFEVVERVFKGRTFTFEDMRFCYGERRYLTFGLFHETPVCIVHTENAEEIRVISFRKATRCEAKLYFEETRY